MGMASYQEVESYAVLRAKYRPYQAAIQTLPAGTRFYCVAEAQEVFLSASKLSWVPAPSRIDTGSLWTGTQYAYYPARHTAISNSNGAARLAARACLYRGADGLPRTVNEITVFLTTPVAAASTGVNDAFDLRIYECDILGQPIVNQAPLFVWSWNAAGSGGAGVGTLTGGAAVWKAVLALPGGAVELPFACFGQLVHNYDTQAPNISTLSAAGGVHDGTPLDITPGTTTGVNPNLKTVYSWNDASWVQGQAPVWPAGTALVSAGTPTPIVVFGVTA
jgi:hypothetical protein